MTELGEEIYSSPVVWEKKVFVGIENLICCFNANTGEKIWSYKAKGAIEELTVSKGRIFAASGDIGSKIIKDRNLYCLDATNGKKLWQFRAKGVIWSQSILSDGKVYLVDHKGIIYCLDAGDPQVGGWEMYGGGPGLGNYNRKEDKPK